MGAFEILKWTYDGAFEELFGPGRWNLNKNFPKDSNARGVAVEMLNLRFDWYINSMSKDGRKMSLMHITLDVDVNGICSLCIIQYKRL